MQNQNMERQLGYVTWIRISCYMDTDSFIVHVKSEDIYADLAEYIKKRYDTSNYEIKRAITHREKQKEDRIDEG